MGDAAGAYQEGGRGRIEGPDGRRVLGLRRGRGAYALLQRADGSVTRAGEAYFGMLGRQPESRTFDPRQPLAAAGGRHLPADEPREAVLQEQVLAARSTHPSGHQGNAAGRQKRGRAYKRRDWLPANVLGEILQNVKRELVAAGDEDRAGRAPIMELSDETYFYEQYRNSRVHVETILRQRLQGLRRVSYQLPCFNNILECAFEDSGENACVPRQRPGAAAAGQPERAGLLERDGGAHQCELIMINDEALVQTKSLSTQLPLTTNQRNPGCLVIAGNTGPTCRTAG